MAKCAKCGFPDSSWQHGAACLTHTAASTRLVTNVTPRAAPVTNVTPSTKIARAIQAREDALDKPHACPTCGDVHSKRSTAAVKQSAYRARRKG